MLKEKIILLLCLFYVRNCLARSSHPGNIKYDYRFEGRRQSFNRRKPVTTTPRPNLQQYWQSFVSNLPTLPPISWNITNPIGNLFNANAAQIIETPVAMNMVQQPYKRKRKVTKRKPPPQFQNYYTTHDNNYHQHMQLQPLGLDHNKVMHFYEPSSGQYYALQVESQPNYYNRQYHNAHNKPYNDYYYNQYNNYGGYYEDNNSGTEDEYYYQKDHHNSHYGYNSAEGHDSNQQYYPENSEYNAEFSDYDDDDENESSQEDNAEYDDGVELADNWGYNDDEIFADRKLKGGSNKLDTIAEGIIKIQKHLLKPETAEDVQNLLSKHRINTHKNEGMPTKKKPVENDAESARNVMGNLIKDHGEKRKKQITKARDNLHLEKKPRKQVDYYILPTKFWL